MIDLTKEEVGYLLNLLKRRQFRASRGKRFIKDADPAQIERWDHELKLTTTLISKLAPGSEPGSKPAEVVKKPQMGNLNDRLKALESAVAAMNNTLLAIHDRLAELTGRKYETSTTS